MFVTPPLFAFVPLIVTVPLTVSWLPAAKVRVDVLLPTLEPTVRLVTVAVVFIVTVWALLICAVSAACGVVPLHAVHVPATLQFPVAFDTQAKASAEPTGRSAVARPASTC
jgi:hypothetical protein